MAKPPEQISVWRITQNDWVAGMSALFGLSVLFVAGAYLLGPPLDGRPSEFLAIFGVIIGIALFCGMVFAWRVPQQSRRLRERWQRSELITASVLSVWDTKTGRSRKRLARFRYEYKGSAYEVQSDIPRNWMPSNDRIDILVDTDKPDDPLVVAKYVSD
jgi:hypothetical protein